MRHQAKIKYDAASAIGVGMRDYQEDAVVSDFPLGNDIGFVVLADGMGGHAAGDIASKIVMTEVFCELKFQTGSPDKFIENLRQTLLSAAENANDCLTAHVARNPDAMGMGATLVAAVLYEDKLQWISIGDSPLYLFRDGELSQLNEDHSMAPQIDFMVRSGLMDAEVGADHPDRNCLTSVLSGEDVPRVDCPEAPVELKDGDIVLVSSDGLQYLTNDEIEAVLTKSKKATSGEIASKLLNKIDTLNHPEQDNVSMTLIKVRLEPAELAAKAKPSEPDLAEDETSHPRTASANASQPAATPPMILRDPVFLTDTPK